MANARSYVVAVEGLSDAIESVAEIPASITRFARLAVNHTARKSRTIASRKIREQVAFSASYLSDANGRLTITRHATDENPEAIITGRSRPTSLARFSNGTRTSRGVRVRVDPGGAKTMGRAFFMKLRAGRAPIETKSNKGLAIRLKPGETIANKHRMVQVSGNLYLLYGPSVDQVFRSVAEDIAPEAAEIMQREFLRLSERFS